MKEITSEQFHNAVDALNDIPQDIEYRVGEVDARRDYIGRGMGWRSEGCVAIVGQNFGDAVEFMLAIAEQMSPDDVDDQKVIISEMAHDMVTDGMGKSVIYYFPGWTVVD